LHQIFNFITPVRARFILFATAHFLLSFLPPTMRSAAWPPTLVFVKFRTLVDTLSFAFLIDFDTNIDIIVNFLVIETIVIIIFFLFCFLLFLQRNFVLDSFLATILFIKGVTEVSELYGNHEI
jgi:hypothetical protein